jgi:pimeloyl-ACP methyl ester carboxylesterase
MPNSVTVESIVIPLESGRIEADLHVPENPTGLVIFAHGSGSSRFSPRNRAVAEFMEKHSLGTLLLDLLTREEEAVDVHTREYRFDIERLARRVVLATDWAWEREDLRPLSIGYFGASTGAAAALIAAAERPDRARAVVSRGGRPDLADGWLPRVKAPTLLIVGGEDDAVIGMNEDAMRQMTTIVELKIVPGATHLFEEPGTLDQAIRLSTSWFRNYLPVAIRTEDIQ